MTRDDLIKTVRASNLAYYLGDYFSPEDVDAMAAELADEILATTTPKPDDDATPEE